MPDRHIFLIGMQGCGKSSLGKRVARETGIPFADTDAIVARSAGGTVNDFYAQYGEEKFRQAETGALVLLTRARPMIISTGGSTVMNPENRHIMRSWGRIIWLDRPLDALPKEGRPISLSSDLSALYARRRPLYERFADFAVFNGGTPEDAVRAILDKLNA